MAFGNGLFVGVGDRGRRACSPDGLDWDDVPDVKPIDTLVDVAFGNGVFVGVGLHGLRMVDRATALTWSEPVRGAEGEHLNSVVWADDRFVAVGPGATYISPDGLTWERRPNADAPVTFCYGRGRLRRRDAGRAASSAAPTPSAGTRSTRPSTTSRPSPSANFPASRNHDQPSTIPGPVRPP